MKKEIWTKKLLIIIIKCYMCMSTNWYLFFFSYNPWSKILRIHWKFTENFIVSEKIPVRNFKSISEDSDENLAIFWVFCTGIFRYCMQVACGKFPTVYRNHWKFSVFSQYFF